MHKTKTINMLWKIQTSELYIFEKLITSVYRNFIVTILFYFGFFFLNLLQILLEVKIIAKFSEHRLCFSTFQLGLYLHFNLLRNKPEFMNINELSFGLWLLWSLATKNKGILVYNGVGGVFFCCCKFWLLLGNLDFCCSSCFIVVKQGVQPVEHR